MSTPKQGHTQKNREKWNKRIYTQQNGKWNNNRRLTPLTLDVQSPTSPHLTHRSTTTTVRRRRVRKWRTWRLINGKQNFTAINTGSNSSRTQRVRRRRRRPLFSQCFPQATIFFCLSNLTYHRLSKGSAFPLTMRVQHCVVWCCGANDAH